MSARLGGRSDNHLDVLVKSDDVLLFSKAWRHFIRPESVRFQCQFFDLDQRVGESAVLHQERALTDPYVQRAGQFTVFAILPLRLLFDNNFGWIRNN